MKAQTLSDATPTLGKLYPLSKCAVNFEPTMWFWYPKPVEQSLALPGRVFANKRQVPRYLCFRHFQGISPWICKWRENDTFDKYSYLIPHCPVINNMNVVVSTIWTQYDLSCHQGLGTNISYQRCWVIFVLDKSLNSFYCWGASFKISSYANAFV